MKRHGWKGFGNAGCVLVLCLATPLVASTARAQTNFAIPWFKIAGGGGTSTGGVHVVSGTIGQPEAGDPMINGHYAVIGGFWALLGVVQSEGSPVLTIVPASPGQATISWAPGTLGFVLQENSDLATTNWVNSPSGAANPVPVPAVLPQKFYRLVKP